MQVVWMDSHFNCVQLFYIDPIRHFVARNHIRHNIVQDQTVVFSDKLSILSFISEIELIQSHPLGLFIDGDVHLEFLHRLRATVERVFLSELTQFPT
jgi:hypothetical protein